MDGKIELIFVPVTDVDRAKDVYTSIGFHADHDETPAPGLRFVQLTPPGSACSIAIGTGLGSQVPPGTLDVIHVVVADADATLAQLRAAGADAEGVDKRDWRRFVSFAAPDGNTWALQQLVPYG